MHSLLHVKQNSGSVFRNNQARTGRGGAFYGLYSSNFTIGSNAIFDLNRAGEGGAIALAETSIFNLGGQAQITSNLANVDGGAIWITANGRLLGGSNLILTNNTAVDGVGGGMFLSGISPVVFNA